jgi:hypothetical protein
MSRIVRLGLSALIVAAIVGAYLLYHQLRPPARRLARLREYWQDPSAHLAWTLRAGQPCGDAPFLMPTDGYIGFLWGDSFRLGHRHQGIDIFGPSGPEGLGQTPVVAAFDGYLTRLPDWRASLIQRVPRDPLQPSRQIWLYYTHMADPYGNTFISAEFPPGTSEVYIEAGTLLGYQGNYTGDPANPSGVHLHFSVVKDDGRGQFLNELEIRNTLDPSPYFGIDLNAGTAPDTPRICPDGNP